MSAEREIEPDRAAELIAAGAQAIDVRTPEEYEAGHLAGAAQVSFDRLAAEAEALDRERAVIVCCRSGERSAATADALAASGWEAYSIAGGLLAWTEQGHQLEPEGGSVVERSQLPPS